MPSEAYKINQRDRITREGRDVTVKNYAVSRDSSSDWDDEDYTETSTTLKAILDRPRSAAWSFPVDGPSVEADLVGYVRDDTGATITDGTGGDEATEFTVSGTEYRVMEALDMDNGTIYIELRRA